MALFGSDADFKSKMNSLPKPRIAANKRKRDREVEDLKEMKKVKLGNNPNPKKTVKKVTHPNNETNEKDTFSMVFGSPIIIRKKREEKEGMEAMCMRLFGSPGIIKKENTQKERKETTFSMPDETNSNKTVKKVTKPEGMEAKCMRLFGSPGIIKKENTQKEREETTFSMPDETNSNKTVKKDTKPDNKTNEKDMFSMVFGSPIIIRKKREQKESMEAKCMRLFGSPGIIKKENTQKEREETTFSRPNETNSKKTVKKVTHLAPNETNEKDTFSMVFGSPIIIRRNSEQKEGLEAKFMRLFDSPSVIKKENTQKEGEEAKVSGSNGSTSISDNTSCSRKHTKQNVAVSLFPKKRTEKKNIVIRPIGIAYKNIS